MTKKVSRSHGLKVRALLKGRAGDNEKSMSYRQLAEKFGVSVSTAHAWVQEFGLESVKIRRKPPKKERRPEKLSDLSRDVLVEAAKATRYNVRRIASLLAPFLPELGQVNFRTIRRALSNLVAEEGYKGYQHIDLPGVIAIHAFPVQWQEAGSNLIKRGEMLCLIERHTGFVFLKLYKQIKDNSLYHCVNDFAEKLQIRIFQVVVTTELLKTKSKEEGTVATINGKMVSECISGLMRDKNEPGMELEICYEDPFPRRMNPFILPFPVDEVMEANERIFRLVDDYNWMDRPPLESKKVPSEDRELCPAKRLWNILGAQIKTYTTERTFRNKIRFAKPKTVAELAAEYRQTHPD